MKEKKKKRKGAVVKLEFCLEYMLHQEEGKVEVTCFYIK